MPAAGDTIRKLNAHLRYYMHIADPDSLEDTDWAMRVGELKWIRETEANQTQKSRR